MAEKVCNLIKSGSSGGLGFPDYSKAISVVDSVNTLLNYTPTENGFLWMVTNTSQILASSLLEDGVPCGVIMNSVLAPVRAGHTYTTNVGIRQARFMPCV